MKAEVTVFSNCIPEVKKEGEIFRVDFGTVVLELTAFEAIALCVNFNAAGVTAETIPMELIKGTLGG